MISLSKHYFFVLKSEVKNLSRHQSKSPQWLDILACYVMWLNFAEEFFPGLQVEADAAYLPRACGDLSVEERKSVSVCKFYCG